MTTFSCPTGAEVSAVLAAAGRVAGSRRGPDRFRRQERPDTVDEETFAFLKEFGLFRVFLGIEAGPPIRCAGWGAGRRRARTSARWKS